MGRAASINLEDVRTARATLIAANKPHGIIAIRNQIGHGSPQLISKLLVELDRHLSASGNPASERSSQQTLEPIALNNAWRTVAESIENLILSNDSSTLTNSTSATEATLAPSVTISPDNSGEKYPTERLENLEQLVTQQQTQLDKLEAFNHKLGEQLMQQQDLFDSWRHEQHAERQLLKTQLDKLMQVVAKKPVRKIKKKGEQLDLYRDGNN